MSHHWKSLNAWLLGLVALALCGAIVVVTTRRPSAPRGEGLGGHVTPVAFQGRGPDAFEGPVPWLNTGGPIKLRELRGKILILHFSPYSSINSPHFLPFLS